jgi:predicted nucleotide-binding protein (sugar kinase/HSP70/actin superfamily)
MRNEISDSEYDPPQEGELRTGQQNRRCEHSVDAANPVHWRESFPRPFTRAQRSSTTIWMAGLTVNHDTFFCAAARGFGYKMESLPVPDNKALNVGKEYGNRGQCNPTYYTVGNLIRALRDLEAKGHTRESLIRDFVLLTAASCGPCRFGMYATEYRKALRDAGYEGFRIEQLVQTCVVDGGDGADKGIEFDLPFSIALVKALLAGDMLNLLGYRIRPYEIEKGATNSAMEKSRLCIIEALENRKPVRPALRKCRALFEAVAVDRLQPKPMVSVIGEIWAMTTEGDGNYQIQDFLEEEGAEVSTQPIFNWLLYVLWGQKHDIAERRQLRGVDRAKRGLAGKSPWKRMVGIRVLEQILKVTIRSFARAAGVAHLHLTNIANLAELSGKYYDLDVRGGEGFLEVGKFIDISQNSRAHLVLSVKPFGCLPSSAVSDGVQSLTTAQNPNAAFYAIETTGDGKASVHSRIQMMLFKVHQRARDEFKDALADGKLDIEDARRRLARHRRYNSALHYPRHQVATTAANLASELASACSPSRETPDSWRTSGRCLRQPKPSAPPTTR